MNQDNGGIIGKINTPTTSVASGVWSLQDQFEAQTSSIWPLAFPQTTIANACRFNDGSTDNLTRTPSGASNRKTWTWSGWVKRSTLGASQDLFNAYNPSGFWERFYFTSGDILEYDNDIAGSDYTLQSTMLFRDTSAWYHLVFAKDTTQSTEADRLKIYVNGSQISLTEVALGYPPINTDGDINNTYAHDIGKLASGSYFDGYMTEIIFVDGQQLTPTNFGAFNPVTNIWEPRGYAGTYGTNGFKLNFADSSALGDDTSGNGNDFTPNNLTSIDQSTDTCSNNFATLNHLTNASYHTLAEGNLQSFGNTSSDQGNSDSTISASSGKWYAEVKCVATNTTGGTASYPRYGIRHINNKEYGSKLNGGVGSPGKYFANEGLYQCNALKFANDATSSFGNSFTANDIIGIAVDYDNGAVYVSKNGTFQNSGDPTSGSSKTGALLTFTPGDLDGFVFACAEYNDSKSQWNFGSPPYAISSGNADANGHGNFEYAVPSDYFALCTKNLSEHG